MRNAGFKSERVNSCMLVLLSAIVVISIGYTDESKYSFGFLIKDAGVVLFFIGTLSAIPLAVYHSLLGTRLKRKAFLLAVIFFLPFFLKTALMISK